MSARDKAMTDDLAQMLADIDSILETDFDTQLAVERDPYGATRAIEAALYTLREQSARIEDLTGQNLRLSGMCYDLKKEVAISDALLISEAEVSLERLARAEAAEAERDRLREALKPILRFVPQSIVECRGDKCRDPWCASCCGEDAANAALDRAQTKAAAALAVLKGESHE